MFNEIPQFIHTAFPGAQNVHEHPVAQSLPNMPKPQEFAQGIPLFGSL